MLHRRISLNMVKNIYFNKKIQVSPHLDGSFFSIVNNFANYKQQIQ